MTILNDALLVPTFGSRICDPGYARSDSIYWMLMKMVL